MTLDSLSLVNFKNIPEAALDFSPKANCFLGDNGMGKSNLLDAIYTLSFTRSFTGAPDSMLLRREQDFFTLRGEYTRHSTPEVITLGLKRGGRKVLKRGGKEYGRLTAHIGLFPAVVVLPSDIDLIRGAAEERRRWMDMVISQGDARYLDALVRYSAALEQRNRLLRDGVVDHLLYDAVEASMELSSRYIHQCRIEWTDRLSSIFARHYASIAGEGAEEPALGFRGSLSASPDGSLASLLSSARRHDEMVRHTSVGPHRDDLEMTLGGMPVRRTGSQGQCKTFTVALRMAQYEFLAEATGLKPLLLLDDIFDKLDAKRVERIMNLVTASDAFGQIFITDTNRRHLDEIVSRTEGDYRLWSVTNGSFDPITQ
ncbi:MAG: DNA replication and repair protein RecF [Pseudoflavonifractor sp.]|nr:DNA replication and repair protein RecF [Alloprevotella sp.]MCM1116950.1 DNA replication and repair protein RecF [Pseudoflavonifractor sp.]